MCHNNCQLRSFLHFYIYFSKTGFTLLTKARTCNVYMKVVTGDDAFWRENKNVACMVSADRDLLSKPLSTCILRFPLSLSAPFFCHDASPSIQRLFGREADRPVGRVSNEEEWYHDEENQEGKGDC